jgi:hypothetical protein
VTECPPSAANVHYTHSSPFASPIRCKRGSAQHGATDDLAFPWKHAKFGYPPNWNPDTDQHWHCITNKTCTIMLVLSLQYLAHLFLFLYAQTDQMDQSMSTLIGSNSALRSCCNCIMSYLRKRIIKGASLTCLWGQRWYENTFGVEDTPSLQHLPPDAEFPAKPIPSNQLWTGRDWRINPTDHVYKIGVEESNCDASFVIARLLAANNTWPP